MTWDMTQLRLTFDGVDRRSLVERLNESGGVVAAHLAGDILVVRPVRQPTLGGLPVYYGGRPEFRGVIEEDPSHVIVRGSLRRSSLPMVLNGIGGSFAAFGALAGVLIVLDGDASGFLTVLFAAMTGVSLLAGTHLLRRLSNADEQAIVAALTAISAQPSARFPWLGSDAIA